MNILITGASGFIGSFLCEEALRRGMNTWAGMRQSSSRKWLQQEKLNFAFLNMEDKDKLKKQLAQYKEKMGDKWDIIVHAAGATKCLHKEDFMRTNFGCTCNLIESLNELDMLPEQFLYVSSLSVLGAIREEMVDGCYQPMLSTDTPVPNTAYGESKVMSEQWIDEFAAKNPQFRYTVFRPTGVYGPREKDYFLMAQSIKQHVDFSVGYKRQDITFVYVRDLVSAIFAAIGKADVAQGKKYFVSDGEVYSSRAFSDLICQELGNPFVLRIKAPLWLLKIICTVSEKLSHLTGKMNALNSDKYHILSQRNWQCDITPIMEDLDWTPEWQLERGTKEAMAWYKENKWL